MRMETKSVLAGILTFALFVTGCANDEATDHHGEQHHEVEEQHDQKEHVHHEHHEQSSNDREVLEKEAATAPSSFNERAENGLLVENTKNVTRINQEDPVMASIAVAQTVWPATHEENQPGTVIVAPVGDWQYSLAALTLVHHPNDGPLLYMDDSISEEVIAEINRLQPKGNDEGIQVLVVGNVDEQELTKLNDFQVQNITGDSPADFAEKIEQIFFDTIGHVHPSVIIGSADDEAIGYTVPTGNWIAHMNESLLFVQNDEIPEETRQALEKREGEAIIYLAGPEHIISEDVENELREYGTVHRVAGDDVVQQAIQFSSFKDEQTNFGWGITTPGHGFVFTSTETPELAIAAAPLAHLGKHAPMLWLENGEVTDSIYRYLATVKPAFKEDPTEGPYNHGYVIGTFGKISFETQGVIDDKLEIVSITGDDHAHH
ncbi:hypothetical protein JCM9140_944 [Halalkalibacter wakoensis JCM 9140]|uniref:ArsR family transcriptional regulator n=1 Tax=Halalkalibacter wakoensis JCM 9140 TaxID=1236970 RepID=W4PZ26_9BACI|nr:hypothetical protein [Halalkalibacter wakoensis]GAE24977.1 hypothetical protein JCM9140_944 [Halalkalibacter wakoensis JCM 9140]